MVENGIAPDVNVPEYITNMQRYNYVKISKYFMLYEFEDPLTHLLIIHPKLLLAATQLRITLKDKFTIIAAYKDPTAETTETIYSNDAHAAGLAIDVIPNNIAKETLKLVAQGSGFDSVMNYSEYLHLEVALKVPSGAKNNA